MIGLDTNILVRYLVQDDPEQARRATELIENQCTDDSPGVICIVVLCELAWVLSRGYGYSREQICSVVQGILTAKELEIESPDLVWSAYQQYVSGAADFSDYLIGASNRSLGAGTTYTFDQRATGHANFTLLN